MSCVHFLMRLPWYQNLISSQQGASDSRRSEAGRVQHPVTFKGRHLSTQEFLCTASGDAGASATDVIGWVTDALLAWLSDTPDSAAALVTPATLQASVVTDGLILDPIMGILDSVTGILDLVTAILDLVTDIILDLVTTILDLVTDTLD